MKKILLEQKICTILRERDSFLDRKDVKVFTAVSNDEALRLHQAERVDLIILDAEMPGLATEKLCFSVRKDPELRNVLIIVVCAGNRSEMARALHFGADAVILKPLKPPLLLAKAKQLLDIKWRQASRVLLSVSIEGHASDQAFSCRSLDIGTTGILMETMETFPNDQRVVCSFTLPDAAATLIRTAGRIVRILDRSTGSSLNRYGIHFQELTADQKKAIENYLDSVARNKSRDIY